MLTHTCFRWHEYFTFSLKVCLFCYKSDIFITQPFPRFTKGVYFPYLIHWVRLTFTVSRSTQFSLQFFFHQITSWDSCLSNERTPILKQKFTVQPLDLFIYFFFPFFLLLWVQFGRFFYSFFYFILVLCQLAIS